MPTVQADRLKEIAQKLLVASGASEEEAEIISRHSIDSNLAGHDSHGIIQIPTYIGRVEQGHIVPGAAFDIKQESPTTAVVDGNWGFGYVVSERAMKMTIERAKTQNIAATTVFHQSHVGRVADYPIMAAKEGMIAMMTADSGRGPKSVAPFGGAEARLGTNPISFAIPSNLDGPLFIDMATSAVAAGKISLALARGQEIPLGWVVNKDGKGTTNPAEFRQGGALLPLGGTEGYKGTAISAIVEILSGILPGLGFGVEPTGKHNDGVFMACFNVNAFRPLETFKQEVTEFAKYISSTKPAAGVDRVFYPGEIEYVRSQDRLKNGIEVEDATWEKLIAVADKYGIRDQVPFEG